MGRRGHSRGKPRAHPRGIIEIQQSGYGFVRTSEGEFFIARKHTGDAFDGDLVEVAPCGRRQSGRGADSHRPEARVVRTLERAHTTLVGIYEVAEPFGIVVPDDKRIQHDIFTMRADNPGIEDGSLVRVCIDEYPTKRTAATGHVIEVISTPDAALLDSERILARHDIPNRFSEEAEHAACACAVDVEEALAHGYRDIRERFIFTIDPSDARDFDDALSIEPVDEYGGARCAWRLGVHIADVSSYVIAGTPLDSEARRRATSVYLVDRVVPMLPEALSCGVCSLVPGEPRRCITVDVYLDEQGRVVASDIYRAIMVSDVRLTYEKALSAIDGKTHLSDAIAERLRAAHHVADLLFARRMERGGIDFITKEAKVRLDENGHPIAIDIRQKNKATALVEEAMILANALIAEHLLDTRIPCAYRVHEPPHIDALEGVVRILGEFKWFSSEMEQRLLAGDAFAVQAVLNEAHGRVEEPLVTTLLLRAMTRAVYSPHNGGHYGLGLDVYCHFTSPIRRYPDLIVHRMLGHLIDGSVQVARHAADELPGICEHASDRERIAETAARESVELKMAEYFAGYIGCEYDAVIAGIATYGVYVQLDCTAEGLIPIRSLGHEYFIYEASACQLRGSDSGRIFRLGQRVHVVLTDVNVPSGELTFSLPRGSSSPKIDRSKRARDDTGRKDG